MQRILMVMALVFTPLLALGQPEIQDNERTESFSFVGFGDRTGGPAKGIEVLKGAVEMTNWLDPDLVMTVGDLVEGQSTRKAWIAQFEEFTGIMDGLDMAWYPVAGNHDVYPAVPGEEGNTELYRRFFGPLIYSFDHKFAHFVVLFSDEALGYHDPGNDQNMSRAQMDWLRADLSKTDAKQVFVFLHHPRWTKAYKGCNWDAVHSIFVEDGRSTTVVAGHINTLRDDGMRENVHYLTLATTGGWPKHGFDYATLHHITQFQVREDSVKIAHIPVGSILPGDAFPGIEFDEIKDLQKGEWIKIVAELGSGGGDTHMFEISNPTTKTVSFKIGTVLPHGWSWSVDHESFELMPGLTKRVTLSVSRGEFHEGSIAEAVFRAYYPHQHGEVQPVSIKRSLWGAADPD
jgi:Calcineurin-like phosphoesterase